MQNCVVLGIFSAACSKPSHLLASKKHCKTPIRSTWHSKLIQCLPLVLIPSNIFYILSVLRDVDDFVERMWWKCCGLQRASEIVGTSNCYEQEAMPVLDPQGYSNASHTTLSWCTAHYTIWTCRYWRTVLTYKNANKRYVKCDTETSWVFCKEIKTVGKCTHFFSGRLSFTLKGNCKISLVKI